jgi:NitT/TauT family transport system permease protein
MTESTARGGTGMPRPLRRRRAWIPPVVFVGLLLIAWEVAFRLKAGPDFLSAGPIEAAGSIAQLWGSGQLLPSLKSTLARLGIAYGLALVVGGLLAALMMLVPLLRQAMQPLFLGMQSMPGLAWVPPALIWFGFTETSLIFVTLIGSVFAVTMGFVDAFATTAPLFEKAARNMGVRGLPLLLRVTVPAATPHLVTTAKVGWSFAWRSLLGAEIIFASVGLGFLLNQGREFLDLAQVFGTMLIVLVLGILFERFVFALLERSIRRRWGLLGPG